MKNAPVKLQSIGSTGAMGPLPHASVDRPVCTFYGFAIRRQNTGIGSINYLDEYGGPTDIAIQVAYVETQDDAERWLESQLPYHESFKLDIVRIFHIDEGTSGKRYFRFTDLWV